ncbi:MAG: hypothetical protein MUE95_07845 [Cyclobacteriaceae bacterium]|jgi:predicted O-methyltransferase YrrM|nr:hypothetical protein [Cyclobacteriaceae bacterium]
MLFPIETAQAIANRKEFIQRNYFFPKSSPLKYARFRVLRPLLKLYHKRLMKRWQGQPVPWMTPAAVEILHALLKPEHRGFEFGSGRSTLFIAPRVAELVSLEHDAKWHQHIQQELNRLGVTRVQYHLQLPYPDEKKTVSYPANNYINYTMPRVPATCFTEYFSFIERFEDTSFDFIIVDGRARVECVQHAIPKLKRGGMLILDNAERLRYTAIHTMLRNWKKVFTTSGITDTVFWFKP